MDLLDNYKKAWENQPEDAHKISRTEIFKMMHAKSSSIVKWIFIIGLLEFIVLSLFYLLFFDLKKTMNFYEDLGLTNFIIVSSLVTIPILFYFLYQFYKNYKNISVVENTKNLMNTILRTRKTVKNYVLFNLSYFVITFIIISIVQINHLEEVISATKLMTLIFIIVIIIAISVCLFLLFYQLLYGFLLKKLNKNYKELVKLDELK